MSKCIVIGAVGRAVQTQKLLAVRQIPTSAFAHNVDSVSLAVKCHEDKELKVVVVYCSDFPLDGGISLLAELRGRLHKRVEIVAFYANSDAMEKVQENLDGMDIEGICLFPTDIEKVAGRIVKQCFNGGKGNGAQTVEKGSNGDASKPGAVRTINLGDERQPLSVVEHQRPRIPTLSSTRALKPAPPPPKASVEPVVGTVVMPNLDAKSAMEELFSSTRRNAALPSMPRVVDIVGKNGTVVVLDPRRIRPLPDNPRHAESPGFTKESLSDFGREIKKIGQMEEVMVCPIVGDPDFDAQLIDGEVRLRAAVLEGIMIWATVREDVTPEDRKKLYVMSIMRNQKKHPHTTLEYVDMAARLRGEFSFSLDETAQILNRTSTWVYQQQMLATLHPDVLKMLGDEQKEGGTEKKGPRRLTSQLALLLTDVSQEKQRTTAEEIIRREMNYQQARRYVASIRRDLGLKPSTTGRRNLSKRSQALANLVRKSIDSFGYFSDMPTFELVPLLESYTAGERDGVCQDLQSLADSLVALAERIKKQ